MADRMMPLSIMFTNCANVDISGSDDNVSIDFRKNMPSNPEPRDFITISLIADLTEQSSADLIDPIIADAIPSNIYIDTGSNIFNITYTGDFLVTQLFAKQL